MNLKLTIPTLRNTLKLNISQAISFNNILNKTDIPYDFNQIKKYWWRWYSEIFGFYYNRVKRTYCIWLTTFLKKNLDIKMSFLFSITGKNIKPLDKYKNYIFLYNLSLNKISKNLLMGNIILNKNNFENTKYNLLSESAKFILYPKNKSHRPIGTFGMLDWELDMFFSSYNANWNNLYNKDSFYNQCTRMSKSFLIIMNSYFINIGFFINSYDSLLNLYPQYFIEYNKKLANNKVLNIFNFLLYNKKLNIFNTLLNNIEEYYSSNIKASYRNYVNLKKNIINLKIYNTINWKKNIKNNKYFLFFKTNQYINIKKKNININLKKKFFIFFFLKSLIIRNNLKSNKNIKNNLIKKLYNQNLILNYKKIKLFDNLFKFFNQFINKSKNNKNNNFLPSNTLKKTQIIMKIKWVTKYKKYFVRLNNNNIKTSQGNFFPTSIKSSKILWYLFQEENFGNKIKIIVSKVMNLILSVYKLNFENYYNNKELNYYFFYLKHNILLNYIHLYRYVYLTNNIKSFNKIDKNLINIIKFFRTNNVQSSKKFNYINLKKLTYLKFFH